MPGRPIIEGMTRGEDAERLVEERLRAALPGPQSRLYVNVNWTGPVRDYGPARDGEADAVIGTRYRDDRGYATPAGRRVGPSAHLRCVHCDRRR